MDNKTLTVTLVAVFIGGLVLGSASFGGLSGYATRKAVGDGGGGYTPDATKKTAYIDIVPSFVAAGYPIYASIVPEGYDCFAYIYNINSAGIASKVDSFEYYRGSGRRCTVPTTYTYSVPLTFTGFYEMRIYKNAALTGSSNYGDFIYDTFTVGFEPAP